MAYIFVNVNRSVGTINPNIYGQFSEHLGRCIYQGIPTPTACAMMLYPR